MAGLEININEREGQTRERLYGWQVNEGFCCRFRQTVTKHIFLQQLTTILEVLLSVSQYFPFSKILLANSQQSIVIFCMRRSPQREQQHATFQVQPQQRRELSINHSVMTSTYSYRNTYEELLHYFKAYSSNKIDLAALHRSSHLRLKKYKEAVYYGEFVDNKREGIGIMVYNSGQTYQGKWRNDVRSGLGHEKFANGCVYEGSYENGKMQGQGKYTWRNGQMYQGEWLNNLKHGTGMWKNQKGDSYLGQWKEGQANGFGVFTEAHGSRYEGNFVNFVKSGEGTEIFQNGDLYKGSYLQGKFNDFGEYYWKDGSYYKGHFNYGMRSGHGIWKKGTGTSDKYEGQFKNNKKQGYGIYTWVCGHLYKGNYKNNLRSGYGEMYWQDGSFYKGNWQLDMQNGDGELFNGRDSLVKGFFIDGELIQGNNLEPQKVEEYEPINPFTLEHQYPSPVTRIMETRQASDSEQQKMKSTIPSLYRDQQARIVKSNKQKQKSPNPLVQQSFLRKKLMQTLQFRHQVPAYSIGHSQNLKKKEATRQSSRETVPHSAFQIHRLHRNRVISSGGAIDTSLNTLDDGVQFAFRPSLPKQRPRYFSRLS